MKTRRSLWKVSVSTTSEAEDAVMELLQDVFGQPASSYTDVETGEITVTVYLTRQPQRLAGGTPALPGIRGRLRQIEDCGLDIGAGKTLMQKMRREDWAESWKRHFKPIEIGSALLIKASWSRRRTKKGQAVVILDPGLSFGTGQHPTTAFCLHELVSGFAARQSAGKDNSKPSFLDIGTGSGILAIAAAKVGYAPVDAFDFDREAVRVARENARKNGVSREVNIRREDVTKIGRASPKKYDLICANLISTLLVAECGRISSRLKQGGTLVLAGILNSEFGSVQRAYEASGLRLIASRTEKEWRSGAFQCRE